VADQIRDSRVSEDEWVRDLSIKNAMDHLQQREQKIIRQRFFMGKTQMEVAREIGISQAQVSRLEKSAIGDLRKSVSVS
jgi:RNA polymerase sporulation-specific sigma factor